MSAHLHIIMLTHTRKHMSRHHGIRHMCEHSVQITRTRAELNQYTHHQQQPQQQQYVIWFDQVLRIRKRVLCAVSPPGGLAAAMSFWCDSREPAPNRDVLMY